MRPQLVALRNAVTNGKHHPHLIGLRLSTIHLQRMPSFFYKRNMATKETK